MRSGNPKIHEILSLNVCDIPKRQKIFLFSILLFCQFPANFSKVLGDWLALELTF